MSSTRKPPKNVSTLVKLGRAGAVPVNSQAARITDPKRLNSKEKLGREIKQISKRIKNAVDPIVREQLIAEHNRLRTLFKAGPAPRVDEEAIENAKRQLERAKWERENPQGK